MAGFVQVFRWPHYVCIFKTLARFPVQTQARIQGFSEHDGRQHDNLRVEPHVIVVEIGLKSQRRHQSRSWALDMSCGECSKPSSQRCHVECRQILLLIY